MSTGDIEKINVRSPYYLTVDSTDAPAEYTPPATLTQVMPCGGEVNIAEDVGTRIYTVDVANRTGTFTLNFTISRPIKITTQFSDESAVAHGFKGDSTFSQQLQDIGVSSSDLTGLASGTQQGGLGLTRSGTGAGTLTITVDAPMKTDDYKLSIACPSETVITEPVATDVADSANLPAVNSLMAGTESLFVRFQASGEGGTRSSAGGESLEVYINGTLTDTLSPAALNWDQTDKDIVVVFTNLTGYNFPTSTNMIAVQTPSSSIKTGDATATHNGLLGANLTNTIAFRFISPNGGQVSNGRVDIGITQLFNDAGTLKWASDEHYGDFGNYGTISTDLTRNPVMLACTFPRRPNLFETTRVGGINDTDGEFYGFHFNPEYISKSEFKFRVSIAYRALPSVRGYLGTSFYNATTYNNTLQKVKIGDKRIISIGVTDFRHGDGLGFRDLRTRL
tara:strand:- start:18316 stop:19665 length:1350 start_codon:yes stop_codon:yes gene_type:complete